MKVLDLCKKYVSKQNYKYLNMIKTYNLDLIIWIMPFIIAQICNVLYYDVYKFDDAKKGGYL